jgi:hypothetical protein
VIVDPSPYGSQSTLTSNAPTVASAQLPADYIPSQGGWGQKSGWTWTTQTRSGVVAARCNYADQYRFQHRASDVPEALRDFVLLPSAEGTDSVLVVIDRARTTAAKRAMHLRFRVPAPLDLSGDAATVTIGRTQLAITSVARTGGAPARGTPSGKDCFADGIKKGQCDAARFAVTDYRLIVPGPEPRAVHAIAATGGSTKPTATKLGDKDWSGVQIGGVRDAVVVWPTKPGAAFTYRAPRGTHVILDGPPAATITATAEGTACVVDVKPGGDRKAPAILSLDAACAVALDPEADNAASAIGTKPPPVAKSQPRRSGCCGAQATPTSPIAMTVVVALLLLVRRRSRTARRADR